jgi:hypothetical protein
MKPGAIRQPVWSRRLAGWDRSEQLARGAHRLDHASAADHHAVGLDRERRRRVGEERIVTARHDRAAQRGDAVGRSGHADLAIPPRLCRSSARASRFLFAAAAALSMDRAARQRLSSVHVAPAPMRCRCRRLCGGAATGSVPHSRRLRRSRSPPKQASRSAAAAIPTRPRGRRRTIHAARASRIARERRRAQEREASPLAWPLGATSFVHSFTLAAAPSAATQPREHSPRAPPPG